jgi:signal transduction histidine kinase
MPATQTLARRLIGTMFPWFILIAFCMTAAQISVQCVSINGDINTDLRSLATTVAPPIAQAVWELDQASLNELARGIRLNAIVTGIRIQGSQGEPLLIEGQLPSGPEHPAMGFSLRKQEQVPLFYRPYRDGEKLIGSLTIYSSPQVVWRRLRSGLYMALLSSIVITGGLWLLFFGTIRSQLSRTVTGVARTVAGWPALVAGAAPSYRIEYPYRDELGDLVAAFNDNRARLAVSMQDLNAINLNLEKIVEARTWELRQAKDAAESADRLKSAFLATMSHELRTPLNSIIGFTGILLQELVGPLNPEQKKQMGIVRANSNHLLELINDVLDISKIEAGQLQVSREPIDLKAIAEKVLQTVQPLAQKKSLDLRWDLPETLEPILSDRRRVEQILMNLLGNAIKFTEAGEVRLRVEPAGADLRIEVSDTGIGMAEADLARLFQPFFQIDTGLTRKYGGTGLGLSICKKLAELLGGRIQVASALGRGSLFTVLLPRTEEVS